MYDKSLEYEYLFTNAQFCAKCKVVHRGADERGLKERLFGSSSSRRRSEGRREGMHKEGGIGRKGDVVEDANQRNKREGEGKGQM